MNRVFVMLAGLVTATGCSRSPAGAETRLEAADSVRADPIAATAPPSASARPAGQPTTFRGTYRSAAAELYIPAEWKDVHWKVKETGAGIGDGAITLELDRATGRVLGTLEGPLGPAKVDGYAADGKLAAAVLQGVATDQGWAGTILATVTEGGVEGAMHVSLSDASAVRAASFAAAAVRAGGPP